MIKAVGYPVIMDLDGNSVYSVYVDNELVFAGRSIGSNIDIAPLLRDYLNSERIIIDWPTGEGIENATPQLNAGIARIYKEATDEEVKIYVVIDGDTPEPTNAINITGRLSDIFPLTATLDAAVPNANISASIGDYQIGTMVTDSDGNFSLQWRIWELDYHTLVNSYGSVLRFVVQKDGYLTSEIQVDIPTDYQSAVQQGISANVQLLMAGDLRVTEVPEGFNMSGKRAYFTNRFKPMDSAIFTNGGQLFGVSTRGNFWIRAIPANGTDPDIIRVTQWEGALSSTMWRGGSEWVAVSTTFSTTLGDAIVSENTLEANSNELWSWNDVIITDRIP